MQFPFPLSTRRRLPLIVLALGLAACAPLPALNPLNALKAPGDYPSARTLSAPLAQWPVERWWSAYGDSQLDRLIDEALRDSPDLAMAAARLRRAEAYGQIAGAALLPQVDANLAINQQKLSDNYLTPKSMTPEGWNDYGRATLDFNWSLDFWGRHRAAVAAASSQVAAAHAEQAQARLQLVAAVASAYADFAQLFAVRATVARSVAVRGKTAELFAERYANGLETLGSLNEAKARRAAAEGELLGIDEQIALQRHRLAALIGSGPDRGLALQRPEIRLDAAYGLPAEIAANLLGRRPDVAAARYLAEAEASRIEQKKADFYPNVNLAAFIGVQSLGLNLLNKGGSSIGSVGPAISLPIFNAGRLRGELHGAVAGYDEAVANYQRTVTQALQEVASAGISLQALSAQIAKGREAVAAAGEAHRVARNRYEGGLATYLEVLYAEDGLLVSQRNLAILQSRAFALDVALKRALGGGYTSTHA